MQLYIVPGDELPIYRQIMRQVIDAVASGRLEAGAQLPSQRDLAEQLVISPLTVKKAYDELERDALIETQRGRGTFVRADAPKVIAPNSGKSICAILAGPTRFEHSSTATNAAMTRS